MFFSYDNSGYIETGKHETNGKPENQECGQGDVITSSWFTLLAEKTRRVSALYYTQISFLILKAFTAEHPLREKLETYRCEKVWL